MMEFLYFPQDRTEYIPAVIILLLVLIAAMVAVYFIKKHSAKQEDKLREFEARVMAQIDKEESNKSKNNGVK
ncbi:hypothetical protein [Aliicoccus persicus]|uniref:Uncharacterized protein n=1 Tax=Aliicoccus persicus TaxID=930138 RepID=A0A662Z3A6_9STAP|nr:hypothetical protein [Aliicoccus persicus]SEW02097.1 hypothetical protein SAMN05192557_1276 [Aliicoccus persicus]